MTEKIENIVIIGSGPAGYTASIYAGRANLNPLVFAGFEKGGLPGGQLMTTTEVENFPGFPEGITGPNLMDLIGKQARRWGANIFTEDVSSVDLRSRPFVICSEEREVKAHSIIIATGATAKRLGLPSEEKFWNAGISACAICDGATPFFSGAELAIIGGGDTACEEAIYLTKYGSHIHLLVRRDELRASKAMQERCVKNEKITVHWNTQAVDVFGSDRMEGLIIKNNKTGKESELQAGGLFYAIGHKPNTELFQGQIELDERGYVVTKTGSVETSVEGVYAAGDVQDHEFRQAITAAGSGCMAAMLAERWLSVNDLAVEMSQDENLLPVEQVKYGFDPSSVHFTGSESLRKLFAEDQRLIVVKYAAPSCGPCHTLKPILMDAVESFAGKVVHVEIDIEQDPKLAAAAGIFATPTVQLFKNKEQLEELKGLKKKEEYRQLLAKHS